MFADLLLLLYVAHLLADYPLQTDHQAQRKAGWTEGPGDPHPGRHHHGWGANAIHAATHIAACGTALLIGTAVLGWTLPPLPATGALLWIGTTHSLIDRRWPVAWWMRVARQQQWAQHGGAAHVDQALHITALAIAALALTAVTT
ncbi:MULTISPECIES: DUF3307 domain-containing protein [Streptomyces]|uniref:DUF3307 domain-containing protein n=1 Tax=Streptomyces harbinensis TaxID=1176198 RepID=A0A1I6WAH4_9ACTN|nr:MULTISPECIES: DUF3307 domain-containing protein [Streptomyces]SFT22988.1 Protein of unknown function [Streptomyces harbinensis]